MTEYELRERLSAIDADDASAIDELYTIIEHADANGHRGVAFDARRQLAYAFGREMQWDKFFPLFARCLNDYDADPTAFDAGEYYRLLSWYVSTTELMAQFPNIDLAQLYGALADVEQRLRTAGYSTASLHGARREIAEGLRDFATEEREYRLWHQTGGAQRTSAWDHATEISRLVARAEPAAMTRAAELSVPAVRGQIQFDRPFGEAACEAILPLVLTGNRDDGLRAVTAFLDVIDGDNDLLFYYEDRIMPALGYALLGRLDEAHHQLRRNFHGFNRLTRPAGEMAFAAEASVVLREIVKSGFGSLDSGCYCDEDPPITAAELHDQMTARALGWADAFDRRNGNTAQGDGVRFIMSLQPVAPVIPPTPPRRKGLLGRFLR
ncbi:hypothetical protein QSJ18_02455 [Gordonia sp. ABSL1-1]|uniref:hypothetical protein n=1 Tax=Gordonia sp. ABSL1-1 TaxID=3053923 RepID=UPI0025738FCF|nr:hypothetical protein [Gordonia sp. ABSL1-1]MDL9935597.1 hypothetical protein [Gordonia sp. ABSL1-1]